MPLCIRIYVYSVFDWFRSGFISRYIFTDGYIYIYDYERAPVRHGAGPRGVATQFVRQGDVYICYTRILIIDLDKQIER